MAGENKTVVDHAVVLNTLESLQGYVSGMTSTKTKVDDLMQQIGWGFKSASGRAFVRKVEEWIIGYDTIMQKYQALHEATTGAKDSLTRANEDAEQISNNWGGPVYSILSGQ
ncbi:hypothetical protein [Streptomyces sp.]|uniref:hypothetical protein n=1 Tax=Streptomyces sp. TaxID=1931 RepID=UPI002F3F67B5